MEQPNGKEVLIVDDESITRESLRDWLSNSGYVVDVAEDGEQALQMIQQNNFKVAVMDLRLPGKDGIKVLREARKHKPNLKGIIITAYPSVDTTTRAIRQGAVDYITKPFEPEELEELIEKVMGNGKSRNNNGVYYIAGNNKTPANGSAISTMMNEERVFPTPDKFSHKAALRSI